MLCQRSGLTKIASIGECGVVRKHIAEDDEDDDFMERLPQLILIIY